MLDDTWRTMAALALVGDAEAQEVLQGSMALLETLGDPDVDNPAVLGWVVEFRSSDLLPKLMATGMAPDEPPDEFESVPRG